MNPDPLRALRAAIRCDAAYMEPTWSSRDAQAFLEVVDGVQHFAVAGTNSVRDAMRDVLLVFAHRARCGDVRKGFADAWDPMRDALPAGLGLRQDLPLVLEAHSLGGPIAQYQALELAAIGFDIRYVETFGCPTGWRATDLYDAAGIPSVNWKNEYDIVAGTPHLDGKCPGTWYQLMPGRITTEPVSAADGFLHPFLAIENHMLEGIHGYIETLGTHVPGWRDLPEARAHFARVKRWNEKNR